MLCCFVLCDVMLCYVFHHVNEMLSYNGSSILIQAVAGSASEHLSGWKCFRASMTFIEVRRAWNGAWYTFQEFRNWYNSERHAMDNWEECKVIDRGHRQISSYMEASGDERDESNEEYLAKRNTRIEVRLASDNEWYTLQEFKNFYGERYGRLFWEERQTIVRGSLVSSYMEDIRYDAWNTWNSVATQESEQDSEYDEVDSDEAQLSLLEMDEVDGVVAAARSDGLTVTKLHSEARRVLEFATTGMALGDVSYDMDVSGHWTNWRSYVCMHAEHDKLIGAGIVRVSAQSIYGTKDPNREGRPRVDLVLHHQDGSYVRLHPGSHRRNDAQLKVSPPSASEHGLSASNQWLRIWSEDGVLTIDDVRHIAQGDRIGRKEAWNRLSSLNGDVPLDITNGIHFLWWLWVASFGSKLGPVIGCGLRKAEVIRNCVESKLVRFERVDDTLVHVGLEYIKVRRAHKLQLSVWLHGTDGPPDL